MPIQPATLPIRYPGRRFQLWAYTVSHRQLLLRSNKSEGGERRCEILFKNVVRLDLPTLLDGVEVEVAAGPDVPPSVLEVGADDGSERTVYRVRARGFLGYVVAGAVACAEDDGEYFTASGLLDQPGA